MFLLVTISACEGNRTAVTQPAQAMPYITGTPTEVPTLVPLMTGIMLPTATIYTYMVVQGDTLIAIAERNGVALDALLAANPGMQTSLPVGATLIIPAVSDTLVEPNPTPALLPVRQANCWPESDGGLWCFGLVENAYADPLENISAQFTLLDAADQVLDSQTAFAFLNTLSPGKSMPLAIHFPPKFPANVSVRVQILTAIRLLTGDVRYLSVIPANTLVNVDASGRVAEVSGQIILTGTGLANVVWVLATAYDDSSNVVGVRRWESPSKLTADTPVSFDFLVSSVGPGIRRVEFLAEARP